MLQVKLHIYALGLSPDSKTIKGQRRANHKFCVGPPLATIVGPPLTTHPGKTLGQRWLPTIS